MFFVCTFYFYISPITEYFFIIFSKKKFFFYLPITQILGQGDKVNSHSLKKLFVLNKKVKIYIVTRIRGHVPKRGG